MYSIYLPNYSLGKDCLNDLSKVLSEVGKKVLIIGGKTALEKAMPKILPQLENSPVQIVGTEIYGHECCFSHMDRLKQIANDLGADVILGVGGGKAIDTAKGTALRANLPIVTIPTIASNCSGVTALSVVYNEDCSFSTVYSYDKTPYHCFIDSEIIANAPLKYFRAGMGDTIAKHYECVLSSRHLELSHNNKMGQTLSIMCVEPILKYGVKAFEDAKNKLDTYEVEQVILAILVTTGLVSINVEEKYNGAIAHATYYALTTLDGFEDHYLHGDAVGYGLLVLLAVENRLEELTKIRNFLLAIGGITKLADMNIELNRAKLEGILSAIMSNSDMQCLAITVTADDIFNAFTLVESL